MAKRNNRVRSSVVGDPEEIDRTIDEEFNRVKMSNEEFLKSSAKEFLKSFVEYFAVDERQPHECIDTFLNHWEDTKHTRPQPEQPRVKTTAAFDNSRLEFLRIQIGPVQSFYQTLGNILFSLSMRLDVVEGRLYTAELKNKMYDEYAILIATEGRIVSMDEFKIHWDKLQKEKGNETRTDAK